MGKIASNLLLLFVAVINLHAQNLVAWYPFNGNANDAGGKGINATYVGTGVTLTADRFGNPNSAYSFDGAPGSYIRMPADSLPTGNRTISLWFNVPSVTNRPGLLGYGGNGTCGTTLLMGLNLLGGGQFYVQGHWGCNAAGYTYTAEPIDAWYHFALTINGSTQKIYVNGDLKSTSNSYGVNTNVAGTDFSLGVVPATGGTAPYTDVNVGYLTGKLDDIKIYDMALSDSAIAAEYNGGGTTGTAGKNGKLPALISAKNAVVTIFDLKGRVMGRGVVASPKADLQKQFGLSGGLYIVKTSDGRLQRKLVSSGDKR